VQLRSRIVAAQSAEEFGRDLDLSLRIELGVEQDRRALLASRGDRTVEAGGDDRGEQGEGERDPEVADGEQAR
jgi:hypothetical protein